MCRSIKVLRCPGTPVTEEEIAAAALQYVRKVSGFPKPSRANQEAFARAVTEIAQSTQQLLDAVARPVPERHSPVAEGDSPNTP